MSFRKRFFAWILKKGDSFNHLLYGEIKRELFQNVRGRVLEIGPGTGVNFKYLRNIDHWFGIEPNDSFHHDLLMAAQAENIPATLITHDAETISLDDNAVEHVICTLVLCSVARPDKAIKEMRRVLKPGGSLIFIEHVIAQPNKSLRKFQNMLNPLNRLVADGCNCNRETWLALEHGGFRKLELKHFNLAGALKLHTPHIKGIAYK